MIVKVHNRGSHTIVAVCDEEIFGKVFEQGATVLDLSSSFYKGLEATPQEAADLMRNSHIVNVVGARAVKLAISEGLVAESSVKEIAGVPYAQAVIAL